MTNQEKRAKFIETVAVSAIKNLLDGHEETVYETLFYLHPDELRDLSERFDRLSELCTNAISDYPDPDIGDGEE